MCVLSCGTHVQQQQQQVSNSDDTVCCMRVYLPLSLEPVVADGAAVVVAVDWLDIAGGDRLLRRECC